MDFPKSVPSAGLVDGKFVDEDPLAGTPGSLIPSAWGNAITLEVLSVIEAAGLTPDENNTAQLVPAIRLLGRLANLLTDTGAVNAYAAVNSPALSVLPSSGYLQKVKIANANTGASTYAPDGLVAKPIYGLGLQPLQGGELPAGVAVLMYLVQASVNGGNGAWIVIESLGGAAQVAPASKSQHAVNAGQIQAQVLTAFTTAGAAPSFTLAPSPAIQAYAAPLRLRVKFSAAGAGADTLNISGLGAKSLKQYDSTGAKVAAVIASGQLTDVEYDGTDLVVLDPLPADPWAMQPIGVPFPVFDHLVGASIPSTTAGYRYIKLTASDAYNAGVLTSESVSGSAPLVIASATISLAGSPMNGQTISLINTERRFIRAGLSGTLEFDQMVLHSHSGAYSSSSVGVTPGGTGISALGSSVNTGNAGTGNETRSKNIGASFYMRIK